MYHYYACVAYLLVKLYQYSGVIDTTVTLCKDAGTVYNWVKWTIPDGECIDSEDDLNEWIVIVD